ncbi:ABC transporter ATP-binding protein [Rhodococcoides yunnanense]|uniref:ABC transporter ATP-binding protein n=1 Tax=Rhodococcoides yunnanense TaxID=278209 RepID=UPI000932D36C|nr:ABC transporter ATP-binding protein [Rhodococcus yunnanensis]
MTDVNSPVTESKPELLPIADASRTWQWLRGELGTRRGATALTVLTAVVSGAMALVPIYVLGSLVDRVMDGAPVSTIVWVIAAIASAAVVGSIFTGLSTVLISRLGETVLADLREATVRRALLLPTAKLEKVGKGDLLSRVGDDVEVISKAVSDVVPQIVSALILVVLSLFAMAGLDWRLGLTGLAALPLYVVALRWYLPRSAPLYAEQRVAMGERAESLISSLHGSRTVRAYRLESRHVGEIDAASARARDLGLTVFRLFTRFVGRENRAEFFGLALILAVGFVLVRNDAVTVGATTAAALLFHRLFNPLGAILFTFDEVQSAGASLARLVGVVTMPGDASKRAVPVSSTGHALVVHGVGHSYDGLTPVLQDIDLHIDAGHTVALVGSTGAGKSTLAAIAAGSIRPAAGRVSVGEHALSELDETSLRRHIAIVTQEVHVFAGTLLDDVRLARPDSTVDETLAALSVVGAESWVSLLPEGIDTVIGEGGTTLTAAQSQQLALARLVLADPPVVILDEATAEAGSAGARDLERSARAAMDGRTALVVAHRLTQAASADRIVVLEHGRILEDGTHLELIASGGRYAELWNAWQGRHVSTAPQ